MANTVGSGTLCESIADRAVSRIYKPLVVRHQCSECLAAADNHVDTQPKHDHHHDIRFGHLVAGDLAGDGEFNFFRWCKRM